MSVALYLQVGSEGFPSLAELVNQFPDIVLDTPKVLLCCPHLRRNELMPNFLTVQDPLQVQTVLRRVEEEETAAGGRGAAGKQSASASLLRRPSSMKSFFASDW